MAVNCSPIAAPSFPPLQAISRGITKAGVAVDMFNLETASLDEVTAAVSAGNGFIIGKSRQQIA